MDPVRTNPPGAGPGASMCTPPRTQHSSTPHRRGTASIGNLQRYPVTEQQSPTAETRLSSIIALINRSHNQERHKATMAEALLGLVASSYDDAPSNKPSITKPDDLPAQLRRTLETKKTPTRCEHISVILDVPSSVEFAIREGDGDAQENIDPALGGLRSQIIDGQPVKVVRAYETIINQPQDNPAIQRAVAKQIVALLSTVDESTWVVREVSRDRHYGWTFTYACKDSISMWNRHNGKNAAKSIIGDYSQKELDPVASGRPAFDCRGTLTIAFSKNSRTISVKYEHTPLHKTVAEMVEHFRPLPPAPPPAPLIPTGGKPKKTPRKRKSEVNEDGTPSQPKKKRKKKSEAAAANAPETSGNGAASTAAGAANSAATAQTKADAAVQSNLHSQAVLNVPPAEAARRREMAIRLLSDNGVDPETLSTEQFSIFANQSPDLQRESLSMLVKYGAERLRIVHPNDAAASSSASASPTPQQAAVAVDAAASSASETPAKGKKKRPRKSKAAADGEEDEELIPAPAGTPLRLVSRSSCISCRTTKAKCNRRKPTCDVCEEQGLDCHYPLAKPKKKSEKSAAQVDDDEEAEAEAEPEPEEPEPEPEEEQEPDDIETIDYTSNMPVANMLTPVVDSANHDYFNSGPSELTYAQPASNDITMSHAVASYAEPSATVTYGAHQATTTSYAQPSLTETASYTQPAADAAYTQPVVHDNTNYSQPAAAETVTYSQTATKSPRATRNSTRRSLPSGQPQNSTSESPVPLPSYAQNWQSMSPPRATNTVSPTMTTRQQRPRRSTQTPVPVAAPAQQPTYDNTQQTAARSKMQQQQQQHRPSPTPQAAQTVTPAQVSPFQAPVQAARAKSRAGHRSSNRTPVNESRATASHHTVQPTPQATMDNTAYNDAHSLSSVSNTYGTKYSSTTNNTADTRIAYEPYAAQTTSAATSTYPSYDSYDRNNTTSQSTNISYTPSNNSRHGQWSNTETRNTQSYTNTATPAASSYTQQPSTTQQQSSSLQSFNMRASAPKTRSSSTKYNQQQPQQQQPTQQSQQSQPQQTQAYGSYPSQSQQASQSDQGHNWYGFGSGGSFTSANTSGYGTRSATSGYGSGTSNANQAYQQHHSSLNMSGHNYTGTDGDIYDLLRNSLHGSGR